MKDGILVVNKSRNWTSHDCVAVCRRVLRLKGIKKIGHGGTLDPMAEGVLPIFIGQATRIMEYMDLADKTYECEARLGLRTDTQDIWGQVLEENSWENVREEDVLRGLEEMTGVIQQMPPMYSAVRIDGKRLYEYARSGKTPDKEIQPRRVHLAGLKLLHLDLAKGEVRFRAVCSRGTYIRTICEDLGQKLGCGCAMSGLTRTAIGGIDLTNSVRPEEVKDGECGDLEDRILPVDAPLGDLGRILVSEERGKYFRQGNGSPMSRVKVERRPEIQIDPLTGKIPDNHRGRPYDRLYRVYEEGSGAFLGIGYEDREERRLKADKVLI